MEERFRKWVVKSYGIELDTVPLEDIDSLYYEYADERINNLINN